jgi:hypothetical protein
MAVLGILLTILISGPIKLSIEFIERPVIVEIIVCLLVIELLISFAIFSN